jgi:hypothetical protein
LKPISTTPCHDKRISSVTRASCTQLSSRPQIAEWVFSGIHIVAADDCPLRKPNNPGYKRYGARGITICARWRTDFVAFLEDMGPRFSRHYSLERIDNAGNYEPSNCRWATVREQANNRRSNRWIEHNGDCRTLAEWARSAGIQGTNPSPEIKQRMADSAGARPSRPQVPARSAFQTLIGAAVFGRPAPYSLPTIIPGLPP